MDTSRHCEGTQTTAAMVPTPQLLRSKEQSPEMENTDLLVGR
jgi:hypothetical protein